MNADFAPVLITVRNRFPALRGAEVLFDNAGGSQMPRVVAERMRDYVLETYVQLDADYETSRRSTETVARAHEFVNVLMNGVGIGEVVFGSSTSALCAMLADCYARERDAGRDAERDEVVVCEAGHEANIAPWERLGERGFRVRTWRFDSEAQACRLEDLEALLGPRTRVVAICHVSNLLGRFENVARITELAHACGARVVCDGVAYAPHRAIDVAAWDVDFYVFSTYKVYGPHMAAMFGKHEAWAELEGPNFYFIPRQDPLKFELGGPCHEACAGVLGLWDYLCELCGPAVTPGPGAFDRAVVEAAFDVMARLEAPLQARLLADLGDLPGVRLIGPADPSPAVRAPTVSFVHSSRSSREIALSANERGIGIRYGHFYAHRLCKAFGLDPDDGVVRASLVHYNDLAEVERLRGALAAL